MIDLTKLTASCQTHEGKVVKNGRLMQYTDSTGNLTEGYGHLVANGLTEGAAKYILNDDIQASLLELSIYPWWDAACASAEPRGRAIAEIYFELGHHRFNEFVDALTCLSRNDWAGAADGFISSVWARQVKERAITLCKMIRYGTDPTI